MLRQPLSDQARIGVAYAAGREAGYDPNGVGRIALSPRGPRVSRDRDGSRCKMKEIPTGCFHSLVPAPPRARSAGYTVAKFLRSGASAQRLARSGARDNQDPIG